MLLNERKIKILQAIINDYVFTAEPVGSRTIAKKYNLGISSATIRNEMSDLEEMGLIMQPHASAGRIPSDKGYRLYVDRLMQKEDLSDNEMQEFQQMITSNIDQIDYLMRETARVISRMTNYTTVVTEAVAESVKLKQIRLIPLEENSIMLINITEENAVKNHIIKIPTHLDEEILYHISKKINQYLKGLSFEEISSQVVEKLSRELEYHSYLLDAIIPAIKSDISSVADKRLHVSGAKNILAFPEFSDIEKAKIIFQTFEEKELLIDLFKATSKDINIIIGNENIIEQLKELSIITTTYRLSGNAYGSIGILGPTRMNYPQVISVLGGIVKNIQEVMKFLSDDG